MASNGDDWGHKKVKSDEGGHRFKKNYNNEHRDEPRRKRPENEHNNVLLFTIINPSYPITTDVLHTICNPNGTVARIVVFRKNGVQAMIEFETLEAAKRVKEALNGADIYAGCCTLKIEYAKPTKLNVYKNDSETWDYTDPDPQGGRNQDDGPPARPRALLPEPPRLLPTPAGPPMRPPNNYNNMMSSGGGGNNFRGPPYPGDEYFDSNPSYPEFERNYNSPVLHKFIGKPRLPPPRPPGPGFGDSRSPHNNHDNQIMAPGGPGGSSVLMVYELDPDRANPEKIFNLFCLYGNVLKVKFLKTKEGCCMVQMADALSAERAKTNLSSTPLINGKALAVSFSKQAYLSDVTHPYDLPDKSLSFKDFSGSRNNRFMNTRMALKNRIQPPSPLLHFFNAPVNITEEKLTEIFTNADVQAPKTINIFPGKSSEDKPASSSSGLIEFASSEYAVDAIMQCNHFTIENEGSKYPYVLKLCFSSARNVYSTRRDEYD